MSLENRIKIRKKGRNHGEVFTHSEVVTYLLDEVGYIESLNLSEVKILEPAAGDGAFVKEILYRLFKSAKTYGFCFRDALIKNITAIELNQENFKRLIYTLREFLWELDCINDEESL